MKTIVTRAHTEKEYRVIYQLRYKVFVEGLQKEYPRGARENREMSDPLDRYSVNFIAMINSVPAGTIRLTHLKNGPFEDQEKYNLDTWLSSFSREQMAQTSRLAIIPEYRKSPLLLRLIRKLYVYMRDHDIVLNFLDCSDDLIPLYERMGFRKYKEPYFHHTLKASYTPMVALLDDVEYLRSIGSPMRYVAVKFENSTKARGFFEKMMPAHYVMPVHHLLSRLSNPLKHYFTNNELLDISKDFDAVTISPSDIIFKEGDPSDAFYMIKSGEVEIVNVTDGSETILNTLRHGFFFGELGVIAERPRLATARAKTECCLLRLTRAQLLDQINVFPPFAITLLRVVSHWFGEAALRNRKSRHSGDPETSLKKTADESPVTFPDEKLTQLAEEYPVRLIEETTDILSEAFQNDSFFIIISGSVEIRSLEDHSVLAVLKRGEFFGEVGSLSDQPRTAKAVTAEKTEVFVFSRSSFIVSLELDPEFAVIVLKKLARMISAVQI